MTIIEFQKYLQAKLNRTKGTIDMFIVNLVKDRETPGTWRYSEDLDEQPEGHPGEAVVGTLYLKRHAVEALGNPEVISVTIEGN